MDIKPKTFWQILEENNRAGHFNFSFNNLIREHTNHNDLEDKAYSVTAAINRILLGEGQREFFHLSPKFQEAMVAIALYCGNGLVAKVIPQSFSDKLPDISGAGFGRAPYLLPSIKSFKVEGNGPICDFKVKLYPYLNGEDVTRPEIEAFREKISKYGLAINEFDDKPLNFKRLPDKHKTITAIDSDMLYVKDNELFNNSKDFLDTWIKHVKTIFPVYYSKEIVRQEDAKDFRLQPLFADKNAHLLALNSEQKAVESKGSWLSKFGL